MNNLDVNFVTMYDGADIIADDGKFLGKISTNKFDSDSILNEFCQYGNKFNAESIFNQFGNYGNPFSSASPFNQFSSTPPKIVKNGNFVAYLTKNSFKTPFIDPDYLMGWLKRQ